MHRLDPTLCVRVCACVSCPVWCPSVWCAHQTPSQVAAVSTAQLPPASSFQPPAASLRSDEKFIRPLIIPHPMFRILATCADQSCFVNDKPTWSYPWLGLVPRHRCLGEAWSPSSILFTYNLQGPAQREASQPISQTPPPEIKAMADCPKTSLIQAILTAE